MVPPGHIASRYFLPLQTAVTPPGPSRGIIRQPYVLTRPVDARGGSGRSSSAPSAPATSTPTTEASCACR